MLSAINPFLRYNYHEKLPYISNAPKDINKIKLTESEKSLNNDVVKLLEDAKNNHQVKNKTIKYILKAAEEKKELSTSDIIHILVDCHDNNILIDKLTKLPSNRNGNEATENRRLQMEEQQKQLGASPLQQELNQNNSHYALKRKDEIRDIDSNNEFYSIESDTFFHKGVMVSEISYDEVNKTLVPLKEECQNNMEVDLLKKEIYIRKNDLDSMNKEMEKNKVVYEKIIASLINDIHNLSEKNALARGVILGGRNINDTVLSDLDMLTVAA